MADSSSSLDQSIQPHQPLQSGFDPESSSLSSSLVNLLCAEQKQDSSTQLPIGTSPGEVDLSLGPSSLSNGIDDPPPSTVVGHDHHDQITAPSLESAADITESVHPLSLPLPPPPPPVLPSSPPIVHHPLTPPESAIAPPALQPNEPSSPTAVLPLVVEPQSPLSSSPQPHPITSTTAAPTTTSTTPDNNNLDTTTTTAPYATDLPLSDATLALLERDLLPTPPVSDCPPQLDSIACKLNPQHLPSQSSPPVADLPSVDYPKPPSPHTDATSSHPADIPSSPHPPQIASISPHSPPVPSHNPSAPFRSPPPPSHNPPAPSRSPPPPSHGPSPPSHIPLVELPSALPPSAVSQHSSPPRLPQINASVNSLSPLSEVPSVHSPANVIESPPPRPRSVPPPSQSSPVSIKRQASPSMHGPPDTTNQKSSDSPPRLNGNSHHTNGQGPQKRPRLDSSLNPPTITSLPDSHLDSSSTPNHPQQSIQSNPALAKSSSQAMAEPLGPVPGHPGSQLTKDQHRFAISVTKQLKKHRSAGPFIQPVDPVLLNIPDYFDVVTHPMDLSTIETRLGKVGKPCYYKSAKEFVADIQLVFANCYLYNGPPHASLYSRMAADLSIQFESQMKKMPPDEPISYAAPTRSPSITKPQPKAKPSTEPRISPPAAKRKNASPIVNAFPLPSTQLATSQKRRSTSPQNPRKKTSKGSAFPDASRAPSNDPSSSHRLKPDPHDQFHTTANHYRQSPAVTEPPSISNSKAELKFCKDVLREVNKKVYEKFVWPFYEPVDIVKLGIPDYPKFVKRPMDLETMKNKLAQGAYPNGAAFAEDFRLMIKNCFAFNPPTSTYYHCGKQLESLFEAKWAERPPPEIPAPTPPPVAPVEPPAIDPIQLLQMQVAQLQERLNVDANINAPPHVIPGTGPPKKQPYTRAPTLSKSLANPAISGPLSPAVAPSTAPKSAKVHSTAPPKPKQSHGGARRKSLGSTLTPAAKSQPQPFEPPVQARLSEIPDPTLQPYQASPAIAAPPSEPVAPPPPSTNRRFSQSEYFEKIDYEQKKDLATQIQNAVEPMQSDAINLIRTSRPDLVPADGEEIELDIDALDDRTLYRLYQLVCAPPPPPLSKGKKGMKGGAVNGKVKGGARRKTGPGAPRKSSTTLPTPYPTTVAPPPIYSRDAEVSQAWSPPTPQVANGHGNGPKPKAAKKPRASAPAPRRKGIDETHEAARIKELEDKLHAFEGCVEPPPHQQPIHSNGVASTNPALGPPLNGPPPAGPVEYASSSSESESESDDDSD